jgi:hypothetical protein
MGTVPVRIEGGVDTLRVERPSPAAMRLRLLRDSSRISLDGVRLGAAGGGTIWESPDYASASNRYDLEMGSGVTALTISATDTDSAAAPDIVAGLSSEPAGWFADQPPAEYPNLAALSYELAHLDQDRCFDIGLEILLDGLERRLLATGGGSTAVK